MALPFDCGISKARNAMLAEVTTAFFVLADEVFRFLETPDFAYCIRFLDAHRDFIGITGSLNDLKEVKRTGTEAKNFALDVHGKGLIVLPTDLVRSPAISFEGWDVVPCDMGLNWGLFRRSAFLEHGLHWDEDFIIGGEHLDFYLRLKRDHPDLRLGYYSGLVCGHVDGHEAEYLTLRKRKTWLDVFRSKWDFRYRIDVGHGFRFFENYDQGVEIPNRQVTLLREQLKEARQRIRSLERP